MSELPPSSTRDESVQHRLHPTSLIFQFGGLARRMLIPGVIVLSAILFGGRGDGSRGDNWEIWIMALFIPAVIFATFRYFTFTYQFAREELIIRHGLIFRKERHIPFKKLQNIDLQQNPLQRLLKVANVKLDTAGGAESEAELKVLSMEAVETLRTRIFAERPAAASLTSSLAARLNDEPANFEESESEPPSVVSHSSDRLIILKVPMIELVKLGIITLRGIALVAILIGLVWELDLWERADLETWFKEITSGLGVLSTLLVVIGAMVVLLILSIAWTILRLHDYTLERTGDDLRLRCGLWTRNAATVPRNRIQFLSVRESLLHKMFGRVSIRIETAGGKQGDNQSDSISEKWIVPILSKADLPRVLNELRPGLNLDDAAWQPLAPRATSRMLKKAVVWGVFFGLFGLIVSRPWGALAIVPITALFVHLTLREARFMSCAMMEQCVLFRSGAWTRIISAAPYEKLQTVALTTSPFDRRYRHARLVADTAGAGPAGHTIRVPYLEETAAATMVASLYEKTERSRFKWG